MPIVVTSHHKRPVPALGAVRSATTRKVGSATKAGLVTCETTCASRSRPLRGVRDVGVVFAMRSGIMCFTVVPFLSDVKAQTRRSCPSAVPAVFTTRQRNALQVVHRLLIGGRLEQSRSRN